MKKTCLLKDLDEVMEELGNEDVFFGEVIIDEEEGESAIVVNELRVVLPALKMEFREGYCGMWQEDEEYYMPDFSLTALYEEGTDPKEYLMWEQDSPLVTLYNYTHKPMDELEQLECVLLLDE